jgi:hypothetical protein
MNGDFVTWDVFGTYAGAVTMTTIITQFLKKIPGVDKCNAQLLAFVVAVLLLVFTAIFNGSLEVEAIVMALINAIVVALASNGAYDVIHDSGKEVKNNEA